MLWLEEESDGRDRLEYVIRNTIKATVVKGSEGLEVRCGAAQLLGVG